MSLGVSTEGEKRLHFKIMRFMTESGVKLRVKSVPLATSARIYHKFFSYHSTNAFDPYLVATTCLYLGGKIEEEHLKLRDVINVCYRCMYKEKPPLEIGSTYWALREAVSQCELLILRVLKFHVSFVHPHKFLLHYLKSVYDWLHPAVSERFPIARTAWAILRDSYHGTLSLRYDPEHIAVSVLYMALQIYGIEVPTSQDAENTWWAALVEDLRVERIRRIVKEIMDVYALENLPPVTDQSEVIKTSTSPLVEQKQELKREPKVEKPKPDLPMDDVDDIDVFLYSDSQSQASAKLEEPSKKKPKSPSPPSKMDSDFFSSLGSSSSYSQPISSISSSSYAQRQEPQTALPGMGSHMNTGGPRQHHMQQQQQQQQQQPKKPIRIPIPDGRAQPNYSNQAHQSSIDVLGMRSSRPLALDHGAFGQDFSMRQQSIPSASSSRSNFDEESYFMGAKSPTKIEDDEDFDLLLFSRSSEPEKKEKKNLFPILRQT